jgi:hypothetical protein
LEYTDETGCDVIHRVHGIIRHDHTPAGLQLRERRGFWFRTGFSLCHGELR